MKLTPTLRRNLILGGIAFGLVATPSFALFGVGDVVFDPTSYASLVSQLTTLKTQYSMLQNNLVHFSWKNSWQTQKNLLEHMPVGNQFGETSGINIALTSNNSAAAQSAWQNATVQTQQRRLHLSRVPGSRKRRARTARRDRDRRCDLNPVHQCRGRLPRRRRFERAG